jgi:hypothetical protein
VGDGKQHRYRGRSFEPIIWSSRISSGLTKVEEYLRREYKRGMPENVREELLKICEPEIVKTESLLNIDLTCWRETH